MVKVVRRPMSDGLKEADSSPGEKTDMTRASWGEAAWSKGRRLVVKRRRE